MATRATKLHLLTTRQVVAAGEGERGDGGGLILRVTQGRAQWVLRYTSPLGRRREMGLGAVERQNAALAGASVTAARDAAHKARELLRQGVDPLDHREQRREDAQRADAERRVEKERQHRTLARAARDYHERVIEPSRTSKHAAQWLASLENHVPAALWHAPIDTITAPALLSMLLDIKPHDRARRHQGDTVPETVQRIRQRLEAIFEDAIFHEHCTSNPAAAIKRKMREATGKRQRGEFRAMSYKEAPAFMARLREAEGTAARCLELAVLAAARTSEVLFAEWAEFDIDASTWTVPAARMKAGEAHIAYLSSRALDVIKSMRGLHERWVFPSPMLDDKPLSNMAMLTVLNRLGVRDQTTVHGLARATFSTWANETGAARPDVIEACLAHNEADRVRAAYNRSTFTEARRRLLQAWSEFLQREPAQVVPISSAKTAAL